MLPWGFPFSQFTTAVADCINIVFFHSIRDNLWITYGFLNYKVKKAHNTVYKAMSWAI